MKILFLTAYHKPETVASSYLWEHLREKVAQNNIEMELYTPMPTRGVTTEVREEYKNKKYEEFFDGKLKVHRFKLMPEKKNPLQRAIRYFIGNIKHYKLGKKAKDIDLIFVASTPPTQGLVGAKVKKKLKVPFVYCLQDVFPDSLVGTGLTKKGSLLWKIGRKMEDHIYNKADKIIVISQDFKSNIMAKGVPENKIEVIYNWVDENEVKPVCKEDNKLYDEFGLNREDFHVVYAGNLGNAQNISIIIDAAKELKEINNLKFVIFGTGGLENDFKKQKSDLELNNVSIFPLQPKERISEVYSLGDVSIVSCKKGLGGSAFPSKTWSIMSAGTAVLASFDKGTELQDLIEKNNLGLFTEAEDLNAFTDAIKYLIKNKDICEKYGTNGRNFILNNLTRDIGTDKYVEVFKSLMKK